MTEPQKIPPEDQVRIDLQTWLERAGCSVWWNEEKAYGTDETFSTSTPERPDLLLETPDHTYYAIEVKPLDGNGPVFQGVAQTFEYWQDLVTERTVYTILDETVAVSGVLLATEASFEGHLYNRGADGEWDTIWYTGRYSEQRQKLHNKRLEPRFEYSSTEATIRILNKLAKRYYSKKLDDTAPIVGIGALLSDCLDDPTRSDCSPAVFEFLVGESVPARWRHVSGGVGQ